MQKEKKVKKQRTPLFRIFFLPSGETEYTGKFPDLTREGKATILNTALELKRRIGANGNIIFVASKAPRAQGSALIIVKVFDNNWDVSSRNVVGISRTLRPLEVRDSAKAQVIFQEYLEKGGMNTLWLSYTCDSRYDDPEIFEPREHVMARFILCLSRRLYEFFEEGSEKPKNLCFIAVSHFEVLYLFVQDLFKLNYDKGDEILSHGELIEVAFWYYGNKEEVWMDVRFRGQSILEVPFNYTELFK